METKSNRATIIGDPARAEQALKEAIDAANPRVVRILQGAWRDAAGVISEADVVEALATGSLSRERLDEMREQVAEQVAGPVAAEWERVARAAAAYWGAQLVAAGRNSPGWAAMEARMHTWIARHGAALVTAISEQQRRAINATISEYAVRLRRGPRDTARVIRGMVGLTERQARAVARYAAKLEAEGVAGQAAARSVARYQMRLERARALTIARTESVIAWSTAQREQMRAAMLRGDLAPGTVEVWVTAVDERVCGQCGPKHMKPANGRVPPLHPNCRCVLLWVEPPGRGRV